MDMHELSVAQNLIDLAEEAARPAGDARIARVYVQIGRLAGVVEESLHFCFDIATQGTRLAGAELVVEDLPVVIYCASCRQERTLHDADVRLRCPVCATPSPTVVQGRELILRALELCDDDPPAHPDAQPEETTHAAAHP